MRADAHYVDQLVAPVSRRVVDDEMRPLMAASKITVTAATATRVELPVLNEDELARSLSAVLSCTDLLSDGMPRLTRGVALDMIRAETQRTICALRTAHVLRHGIPIERRLLQPRAVIERVAATVAPETRLRGCRVTIAVDVTETIRISGEEGSLVNALSAVVLMLSSGLQDVQGAHLDLKAGVTSSGHVTFAIAQDSVILPDSYLKVVNADGDLIGAPETAALLALRQIAEACGGHLAVSRLPHGTQVSIELPTDAA
jgi:hypothetical protein